MDEADVKTNKNEIEFNSFCLFLSFNFILVVFEVAEKYGHETLEFGTERTSRDHQIICGFCGFNPERFLSCFVRSSTQQSVLEDTKWCERSDYGLEF